MTGWLCRVCVCVCLCAVDNRDLLTPAPLDKDGKRTAAHPVKGVDFDPSPYRVLRRILLDYLEVDPGMYLLLPGMKSALLA